MSENRPEKGVWRRVCKKAFVPVVSGPLVTMARARGDKKTVVHPEAKTNIHLQFDVLLVQGCSHASRASKGAAPCDGKKTLEWQACLDGREILGEEERRIGKREGT